jgi:hypothetical protein
MSDFIFKKQSITKNLWFLNNLNSLY